MSGNGHDFSPDAQFGMGGSMFSPEQLEAKLSEPVTMTRGKLAEYIHEGVMELNPKMQEQFDANELMVSSLEAENIQLRRDITALEHRLKDGGS